ncbi:MAG: 4'-phosphopantetheinyl transferase superfamily protein [Acidobacteriota bacterium]
MRPDDVTTLPIDLKHMSNLKKPAGLPLTLEKGEVHVWIADIGPAAEDVARLGRVLDRAEVARASRFHFDRDREAFTLSRGSLRVLLGRYIGQVPERVRFGYGPYGKPYLAPEMGSEEIHFNISHTENVALFAFGRSMEVGIDVERVRALPDLEDLAERFFSREESEALRNLPENDRARAFFRCWTSKEAYIKGIGEGLSMPLDSFAVALDPAEGPIRLRLFDAPGAVLRWRLQRFEPSAGYVAALAVEGESFELRFCGHPEGEGPC